MPEKQLPGLDKFKAALAVVASVPKAKVEKRAAANKRARIKKRSAKK